MKLIAAIIITAALLWFLGPPDSIHQIIIGAVVGAALAVIVAVVVTVRLTRW